MGSVEDPKPADERPEPGRSDSPHADDLNVFVTVARQASVAAAARARGVSPVDVTERIKIIEAMQGTSLFHRSTRRAVICEDEQRVFHWAQKILDDSERLAEELSAKRRVDQPSRRDPHGWRPSFRPLAPALGAREESTKLRGPLSTNHGQIATL